VKERNTRLTLSLLSFFWQWNKPLAPGSTPTSKVGEQEESRRRSRMMRDRTEKGDRQRQSATEGGRAGGKERGGERREESLLIRLINLSNTQYAEYGDV
jgi:hypothetical protein